MDVVLIFQAQEWISIDTNMHIESIHIACNAYIVVSINYYSGDSSQDQSGHAMRDRTYMLSLSMTSATLNKKKEQEEVFERMGWYQNTNFGTNNLLIVAANMKGTM
jgi:hypothetical protein